MKNFARRVRRKLDKAVGGAAVASDLDYLPIADMQEGWSIPEEDFISSRFDFAQETPPKRLFLLLSTPRSGSTWLSDLLRRSSISIPHEYFQASQYMQVMNERWHFADPDSGRIEWSVFASRLRAARTGENGWLAINLHGSHLARFSRAATMFSDLSWTVVHLRRDDLVSQALSWCEARATRKWAASFEAASEWAYDYDKVEQAIALLQRQNLLIETWIRANGLEATTIGFDQLKAEPAGTVAGLTGLEREHVQTMLDASHSSVVRQSSAQMRDVFRQRFEEEFLEREINSLPKL